MSFIDYLNKQGIAVDEKQFHWISQFAMTRKEILKALVKEGRTLFIDESSQKEDIGLEGDFISIESVIRHSSQLKILSKQPSVLYVSAYQSPTYPLFYKKQKQQLLQAIQSLNLIIIEDARDTSLYPSRYAESTLWQLSDSNASIIQFAQLNNLDKEQEESSTYCFLLQKNINEKLLHNLLHNNSSSSQVHSHVSSSILKEREEKIENIIKIRSHFQQWMQQDFLSASHIEAAGSYVVMKLPSGLTSVSFLKAIDRLRAQFPLLHQLQLATIGDDSIGISIETITEQQIKPIAQEIEQLISQFTARS